MLLDVVVPIVHVIACVFLIVVVLLQTGKGADMGAVFGGGGSQTLFGATGAGNLLTKLTTAMAVTFMATSLTLAVARQSRPGSDLLERLPEATAPLPPPAAPGDAAAPSVPPVAGDAATGAAPVDAAGAGDVGDADTAPVDAAPAEPAADAPPPAAPTPAP